MFGMGTAELLIVAAVVLVLFGKRIPLAMQSLGSSMREFRRGIADGDSRDQ